LEEEKQMMTWLSLSGGGVLLLGLATLLILWSWSRQKRRLAESHILQLEQEKQLIATQSVLDGELQERSRLAQDLHDGLGSMLTGLKLNLELLKGKTSTVLDDVQHFDNVMHILDNSMVEMRRLAHHLMPDALHRFGLKAALSDFLREIPNIEFAWFGSDERINNQKREVMIFRIIQELVNNALKHSGASKIGVNVMRESDYIAFTVFDNGCGFDPSATSAAKGMGLSGIRQRVASCDGRLEVSSTQGQGTEINVELKICQ
jgi:signal transduction histidine kinase